MVYAGTRLDLYAMNGGCCAKDRFGAEAPSYPGVDLPASALLDTLLLPLSVLTVLGVGFNATGGLQRSPEGNAKPMWARGSSPIAVYQSPRYVD